MVQVRPRTVEPVCQQLSTRRLVVPGQTTPQLGSRRGNGEAEERPWEGLGEIVFMTSQPPCRSDASPP